MNDNDIYLLAVNIVITLVMFWVVSKICQWLINGNKPASSISEETWRKVHDSVQEVARKHEND